MVSKRTKAIVGAAAAAAAIAGLIYGAKKLHEKGYDKKAVKALKDYSKKLKAEAIKLERKAKKQLKTTKKAPAKRKKTTRKRTTRKRTAKKKR